MKMLKTLMAALLVTFVAGNMAMNEKTQNRIKVLMNQLVLKDQKQLIENKTSETKESLESLLETIGSCPKKYRKNAIETMFKNYAISEIVSCIDEKKITNAWVATELLPELLRKDSSSALILAKLINKKNLTKKCSLTDWCIAKTLISEIVTADSLCVQTIAKLIDEENYSEQDIATYVVPALIKADSSYVSTVMQFIDKSGIKNKYVFGYIAPELIKRNASYAASFLKSNKKFIAKCGSIWSYLDLNGVTEIFFKNLFPVLLSIDPSYSDVVKRSINNKDICALETSQRDLILQYALPEIIKNDDSAIQLVLELVNTFTTRYDSGIINYVLPALLENAEATIQAIDEVVLPKLPSEFLMQLIPYDTTKRLIKVIKNTQRFKKNLLLLVREHDLVDLYLVDNRKGKECFKENITKESKNKTSKNISTQHFNTTYKDIVEFFDKYFMLAQDKGFSILNILRQEKLEHEKKRFYQVYHGRNAEQFVTDHVFQYLQEIFFLSGEALAKTDGKEIDKTSCYAQHYAFPGETHESGLFSGLPINYSENKVSQLVDEGVTNTKDYTHERSSLQFASDLFGVKDGSSALDYTLKNTNAGEGRADSNIDELFKRLGKALGKEISNYYKKYKRYFEQITQLSEEFEHGTMLMYSFTKDTFKKYVYVTRNGSGKRDVPVKIDGQETFDPVLVQDTLRNNPELFDDQSKKWEYCMVLTDEGIANPFHEDIKTYHFNIGKHDEQLAKEIKQKIAYLFERIKYDMAQDGILEYPIKKSKL